MFTFFSARILNWLQFAKVETPQMATFFMGKVSNETNIF